MSPKQVSDMAEHLKSHDSAHFLVNHEGVSKEYKLVKHDGHFRIHTV
ncbi:MAG: hypothetical protein WCW93_02505 [Candidatus Paceibacterota bacterium]